jgi:hypothetical protein
MGPNKGHLAQYQQEHVVLVKVNKFFTLHMGLVVGRYGRLTESKLDEVLERLRTLFRRRPE